MGRGESTDVFDLVESADRAAMVKPARSLEELNAGDTYERAHRAQESADPRELWVMLKSSRGSSRIQGAIAGNPNACEKTRGALIDQITQIVSRQRELGSLGVGLYNRSTAVISGLSHNPSLTQMEAEIIWREVDSLAPSNSVNLGEKHRPDWMRLNTRKALLLNSPVITRELRERLASGELCETPGRGPQPDEAPEVSRFTGNHLWKQFRKIELISQSRLTGQQRVDLIRAILATDEKMGEAIKFAEEVFAEDRVSAIATYNDVRAFSRSRFTIKMIGLEKSQEMVNEIKRASSGERAHQA